MKKFIWTLAPVAAAVFAACAAAQTNVKIVERSVNEGMPVAPAPVTPAPAPAVPAATSSAAPAPVVSATATPAPVTSASAPAASSATASPSAVTTSPVAAQPSVAPTAPAKPAAPVTEPAKAPAVSATPAQLATVKPAAAPVTAQPANTSHTATHTVERGDTLYKIARRYQTTPDAIKNLNNLSSTRLDVGQVLAVPGQNTAPASTAPAAAPKPVVRPAPQPAAQTAAQPAKPAQPAVTAPAKAPAATPATIESAPVTHTVARGDTLYKLSRQYGTTPNELKSLNNLDSGRLAVGQVLIVKPGSTATAPAQAVTTPAPAKTATAQPQASAKPQTAAQATAGTAVKTEPTKPVKPAEQKPVAAPVQPAAKTEKPAVKEPAAKQAAPAKEPEAEQPKTKTVTVKKAVTHKVQKGDTLASISRKYNTSIPKLRSMNRLGSTSKLIAGQTLVVRPAQTKTVVVKDKKAKTQTAAAPAATAAPATAAVAPKAEKPVKQAADTKSEQKEEKSAKATQTASGIVWGRPAAGKIVSTFEQNKKGIDISGKAGDAVMSAADGTVYYANTMKSFGKLIVIKHTATLMSAYAYNRKLLVKEGAQVKRGQKIAEMGRDPNGKAVLHFEIRSNSKPVDPKRFLPE